MELSMNKFACFMFGIIMGFMGFLTFVPKGTFNPESSPYSGRFDVSVHYEDSKRSVYTVLDTVFCKQYLGTSDGGLEFLEINKPCLNRKKARNQ